MNNYQLTRQVDINEYIDHKDLQSFNKDIDFMPLLRNINNWIISTDYSLQIQGLNELRRLLKYQKELFLFVFSNLYTSIPILISSFMNSVSKLTLILLSELFSNDRIFDVEAPDFDTWIKVLIPPVLDRATITQDNIFKQISVSAMKNLSDNIFKSEVVELLLIYLDYNFKNENIGLILNIVFNTLDNNFTEYDDVQLGSCLNWDKVIESLITLYNYDNEYCKKRIEGLLLITADRLGDKELFDIFQASVCTDSYDDILKIYSKAVKEFK